MMMMMMKKKTKKKDEIDEPLVETEQLVVMKLHQN
jgi:hypothetical protein